MKPRQPQNLLPELVRVARGQLRHHDVKQLADVLHGECVWVSKLDARGKGAEELIQDLALEATSLQPVAERVEPRQNYVLSVKLDTVSTPCLRVQKFNEVAKQLRILVLEMYFLGLLLQEATTHAACQPIGLFANEICMQMKIFGPVLSNNNSVDRRGRVAFKASIEGVRRAAR